MEQLKTFFKNKSISNILDVATGKGQFIKALMDIFPEATFTGIDPDTESLMLAEESFHGSNVKFLRMNSEKLDFGNGQFGLVSISNGLHHLPDIEASLSEMKRVVKPGGWIVISEHVSDNLSPAQENQKFYHHLKSLADRHGGNYHRETWKKQEILNIILRSGIHVETFFDYSDGISFINETKNTKYWVNKFREHIEELKGLPVYQELLPKVDEFRKRIEKEGMEHAANVVVIGKKE